jgi:hypothetical protein
MVDTNDRYLDPLIIWSRVCFLIDTYVKKYMLEEINYKWIPLVYCPEKKLPRLFGMHYGMRFTFDTLHIFLYAIRIYQNKLMRSTPCSFYSSAT